MELNQITNKLTPTTSKRQIQQIANQVDLDSLADPKASYLDLKKISDLASSLMARIKPVILEELEEPESINNAELSFIPGRKTVDFSHYEKWVELKTELKRIEGLMKAAQKEIGKFTIVDDETGEVIPAAKISKVGDPSIKVKY